MKKMSRNEVLESVKQFHNHSWFEDIKMRNQENKDKTCMFFRGTKITYGEFFDMVESKDDFSESFSRSLKYYGVEKGDEFVACLRQTPDYPALVGAASYIGATVNLVAPDFDPDYLTDIIDKSNSKLIFVADWDLAKISYSLHNMKKTNTTIVVLPVSKWDKLNNPYSFITDKFYKFDKEAYDKAASEFKNLITIDEFLKQGLNYHGEVNGHGKLDDVIAITYTSGSTKKGIHKGIEQKNKTYIIMGRYHDPEVAGIPKMDNTITSAAIGPHADTTLLSGVSDTMMQGGTVALDPIIDENYFLYSLKINNSGLAIATRTYWLNAMKQTYTNPDFIGLTLPGLYVPSEGGEPMSPGEEKALNKWLKFVKAGVSVTKTPMSITKMSIGGGDSEHGSIFLKLFRDYYNPLNKIRGIREPMGMDVYDFVDLAVLREDGSYCNPMEMGRLVANSPISMENYHNDSEATSKYFIHDAYGKTWGDLCCYGYVDKWGQAYVKGRIGKNDPKVKNFEIADSILRDTKNIMSCEVIDFSDDTGNVQYVAHIETQYFKDVNLKKTLESAKTRIFNDFGPEIANNVVFRIRSHEEGFPTLFTAKRNLIKLREEGIPIILSQENPKIYSKIKK